MTDASAILASLDRFIEQLTHHAKLMSGHQVATQISPMATTNPLSKQVTNHSYHSGHPEQDNFVGADHERCDLPPCPAKGPDASLARKVSSMGGYNGKSGKSLQNQVLTDDHRKNASGQSGNSISNRENTSGLAGDGCHSVQELTSPADTYRSDPAWWRDQYETRSRQRELGGQRSRAEAELLAWRELEWRWHKTYGERMRPGFCAGCRRRIDASDAIPLIDGSRVHAGGYDCLVRYGEHWRDAASRALAALGLQPPTGAP